MIFNKHLELNGGHAVFGASQSSWLRYDDEKMVDRVSNLMAKNLGTEIHDFARSQIEMRIRSRSIKNLMDSLHQMLELLLTVKEYNKCFNKHQEY